MNELSEHSLESVPGHLPPPLSESTLWQMFKVRIKEQQQEMNCPTGLLLFAEAL